MPHAEQRRPVPLFRQTGAAGTPARRLEGFSGLMNAKAFRLVERLRPAAEDGSLVDLLVPVHDLTLEVPCPGCTLHPASCARPRTAGGSGHALPSLHPRPPARVAALPDLRAGVGLRAAVAAAGVRGSCLWGGPCGCGRGDVHATRGPEAAPDRNRGAADQVGPAHGEPPAGLLVSTHHAGSGALLRALPCWSGIAAGWRLAAKTLRWPG